MTFFHRTTMSKESAQWIGNSLYSVMITFTLSFTFFKGDLSNISPVIQWSSLKTWFCVILFLYYIVDWLSFNAILDYDEKAEHLQVFFTIIFILILGWLLVMSSYLSEEIITFYARISFIYLLLTSLLGGCNLLFAHMDRKAKKADYIYTSVESFLRALVATVILIYSYENIENGSKKLIIVIFVTFLFSLILKYIRYAFLLLKWVREVQHTKASGKNVIIEV